MEKNNNNNNKSIELVKTKIPNPKFFIWSNDFTDMENYYDPSEFIFIKNVKNKNFYQILRLLIM